jgi:septum site-determining protein MinC
MFSGSLALTTSGSQMPAMTDTSLSSSSDTLPPRVQIKGLRDGLLLTVGEGSWEAVHQALLDQIDAQIEFLRGASLALDLGGQTLKVAELAQLHRQILDRGLTLWAVISTSPVTEATVQTLGFATQLAKSTHATPAVESEPETAPFPGEEAIFVQRTLRSGASLVHPGHVIILGDVNPGAEVKAGGNIFVWGRLRGMAHAGSGGKEDAVVAALDLSPTQLRIAGVIAVTPQRRGKAQPELARLHHGQLIAEPWKPQKSS